MQFVYTPERVCSKRFMFDIDETTRVIRDFQFMGGCPGNLNGISRLVKGLGIDEVMQRFADMPVCPSSKVTSCPEQIRKALEEAKALLDSGKTEQPRMGLGLFSALRG